MQKVQTCRDNDLLKELDLDENKNMSEIKKE